MASLLPGNYLDHNNAGSEMTRHQLLETDYGTLILQINAFLDAAEDVDIDPDTMEDILQAIPTDYHSESGGTSDLQDDGHNSFDEAEIGDLATEEADSALYSLGDEAQRAWTPQELKEMMHHLKEKGMSSWIREYVSTRNLPVPRLLLAFGITLREELANKRPTTLLYFLKVALSRELRQRDRLIQYNTIADAISLIRSSRRIVVLTGAGISVSCGIPDFRSRNGLYASLRDRGQYDLDDPQQMFDINYFRENPAVFYSFASQIYPSNFIPSPCHRFIKLIEDKNQLLRNYTQNIDTLETLAGVRRVLQCHGSFATASCLNCRRRVPGSEIEVDILNQKVPICAMCHPPGSTPPKKAKGKKKTKGEWDSNDEDESDGPSYPLGIMKPDITFFGEKLTEEFDHSLAEDRERVDLLLVIGTSLKVSPVAEILSHLPHSVPQILINKTPIRHINPDIILLGNADDIVQYLCEELDWKLPSPPTSLSLAPIETSAVSQPNSDVQLPSGTAKNHTADRKPRPPRRVGDSHVWLFEGAEGGRWLQELKRELAAQTPSLTPLTVDSRSGTRIPSPGLGGEVSAFRKRGFLDIDAEDRILKKVKAEREGFM